MTDSVTFEFHNDFVSSLAINPYSPFCFASGDTEGKVAIWKLGTGNSQNPFFIWESEKAISSLNWNKSGLRLGVADVGADINVISFPKSKLTFADKVLREFASTDIITLNMLK